MTKNYLLKKLSTNEASLYSNAKKIAEKYGLKERLKYHFSRKKSDLPFEFSHEGENYTVTKIIVQ